MHIKINRTKFEISNMKRNIISELEDWKNDGNRKPLLLKGIPRSGKTSVLQQFGRDCFSDTAYFNFEETPELQTIFQTNLTPRRILTELGHIRGKPITPGKTLLILDEIQVCLEAILSLKYFADRLHIACTGSLIGPTLARSPSFPIEEVNILTLRPMDFTEFLQANDCGYLVAMVEDRLPGEPLMEEIMILLDDLCREYLITGGMPEAVCDWIAHHDITRIDKIHKQILQSYTIDFAEYVPKNDISKLTLIWDAIPRQLAKKNRRFIFSHVKNGAREKDLRGALQWLIDADLVHKVERIYKPVLPLAAHANTSYFKLYFADVGLFRTLAGIPAEDIFTKSDSSSEIRKALTENFVLTELIAGVIPHAYFWKSKYRAKVDFVIEITKNIIPLEVNQAEKTWSGSLARYQELYRPKLSLKISQNKFWFKRYKCGPCMKFPLHCAWQMPEDVRQMIVFKDSAIKIKELRICIG